MEECMNFCARYLDEVETKSNRPTRNDDGGNKFGRPLGKGVRVRLDDVSWVQTHSYVLFNADAVTPFREQHIAILQREMPRGTNHHIQKVHSETFHSWFSNHFIMAPKRSKGLSMDSLLQQRAESQRLSSSSHSSHAPLDKEVSSESILSRQTRGPALGLDDWGTECKMHLEFNSKWQVIGPNSANFTTHLGIIAKNGQKVPLTYVGWNDMPEDIHEQIWKGVKENTDAPVAYKPICLKHVGKLWKTWKSRVKANHYIGKTDEEHLASTPNRVVEEQWRTLVAYWSTEEVQAFVLNRIRLIAHNNLPPLRQVELYLSKRERSSILALLMMRRAHPRVVR